jgi:hypothetical protein
MRDDAMKVAETREYERDDEGEIIEKEVAVPYRPEFVKMFPEDTTSDPHEVPWKDRDILDQASDEPWPTGELRKGEMFPTPFRSNLWALDERICQRFGFSMLDVSRVELPALDYGSANDLNMRVFVRVLASS